MSKKQIRGQSFMTGFPISYKIKMVRGGSLEKRGVIDRNVFQRGCMDDEEDFPAL